MTVRLLALAGLLVTAGCSLVLATESQPGDAGPIDDGSIGPDCLSGNCITPLRVSQTPTATFVDGEGFTLEFSTSTGGLHGLVIDGMNVLAMGAMSEFHAGVATAVDDHSVDFPSTLTVEVGTPAFVVVRVAWVTSAAGGFTTFAVHPDGRIHRFDNAVPLQEVPFLTAYIGLNTQFTELKLSDGSNVAFVCAPNTACVIAEGPVSGAVCAHEGDSGRFVGLTNRELQVGSGDPLPSGLRATANNLVGEIRVLQSDWQRPNSGTGPLPIDDYSSVAIMRVGLGGESACDDFSQWSAQVHALSDADEGYNADRGILEFENDNDGDFVVSPLTEPISRPTLLITEFGGTGPVRVQQSQRPLVAGSDYIEARVGNDLVLHLAGDLLPGEDLAIAVR